MSDKIDRDFLLKRRFQEILKKGDYIFDEEVLINLLFRFGFTQVVFFQNLIRTNKNFFADEVEDELHFNFMMILYLNKINDKFKFIYENSEQIENFLENFKFTEKSWKNLCDYVFTTTQITNNEKFIIDILDYVKLQIKIFSSLNSIDNVPVLKMFRNISELSKNNYEVLEKKINKEE